ncbi:MAG: hypothetical protein C5B52_18865 [Bacteroidetes bacterium]|nr:MAG: hypothetical protein C5B52_18865 [Bacteroidota bacterium]
MAQRIWVFIVALTFFWKIDLNGQTKILSNPVLSSVSLKWANSLKYPFQESQKSVNPGNSFIFRPVSILKPDFYVKQLGFFCRQERVIEKHTFVPFRFRLGSLEACNILEGKESR